MIGSVAGRSTLKSRRLLKRPWKDIDPAVIGALKLKRRLAMLALNKTTDETFAKMQGLPSTRLLSLLQCSCGDAGMARLAKIADGVEELKVQGPFDPANLDRPPAANPKIGDTFLKGVGKIASLNDIELFALPITDTALPHLATLERLKRLEIGSCPDIHGEGFAGWRRSNHCGRSLGPQRRRRRRECKRWVN